MILNQTQIRENKIKLCFDDILLVPEYSELNSRTEPCIKTTLNNHIIDHPVIPAPMDSITQNIMMQTMCSVNGIGILTRFINDDDEINKQCDIIKNVCSVKKSNEVIGCAIGIKKDVTQHATKLLEVGCNLICLDVAHAHHYRMGQAAKEIVKLKNTFDFTLMAGNVCTSSGFKFLEDIGVDIIKVGIGPGASCTTRKVTGFGIPQLSAVLDCSHSKKNALIVCDGGIRSTGDMVRAFWAGADFCMSGFLFAGTSDTPDFNNQKAYRGMSSRTVHQRKDVVAEGVDMKVPYAGSTRQKLESFAQGIKAGFSMAGAHNIEELRKCKCVQVSSAVMKESNTVSVL